MNNLVLNPKEKIKKELFEIHDFKRLNHIKKILKLKKNDSIKICLLESGIGTGMITQISDLSIQIAITEIHPGHKPWANLIVGLSRPQTCKKILEHATCLGAKTITFFKAALTEKSYLDAKLWQNKSYEEFLINGISQSSIYFQLPKVKILEHFVPSPVENYFILTPTATKSFKDFKISSDSTILIGPERGWTDNELVQFKRNNINEVNISPSILRTEVATYSALSQLQLLSL